MKFHSARVLSYARYCMRNAVSIGNRVGSRWRRCGTHTSWPAKATDVLARIYTLTWHKSKLMRLLMIHVGDGRKYMACRVAHVPMACGSW